MPSEEWLKTLEKKKSLLNAPNDFNEYFSNDKLFGRKLHKLEIGDLKVPTGKLLVCDPLAHLRKEVEPYYVQVTPGEYPITVLVVEVEEDHYRYVAVKVKFTQELAVEYSEALVGSEDLNNLEEGDYFGFGVDAGLATIIDEKTRDEFCYFRNEWEKKNKGANIYDDYFASEFKKSFNENPVFQRDAGDWINFKIPNTDLNIPMIQSGFGDGVYPAYFGFDKDGMPADLVVQFIDLELTFTEE
ncbi:MAG: DUF4241 domain-containing protein [Flavobacteriales bacterium]|nr:DUF4241 domain-containing protein [Flavobacteriales bacterium]